MVVRPGRGGRHVYSWAADLLLLLFVIYACAPVLLPGRARPDPVPPAVINTSGPARATAPALTSGAEEAPEGDTPDEEEDEPDEAEAAPPPAPAGATSAPAAADRGLTARFIGNSIPDQAMGVIQKKLKVPIPRGAVCPRPPRSLVLDGPRDPSPVVPPRPRPLSHTPPIPLLTAPGGARLESTDNVCRGFAALRPEVLFVDAIVILEGSDPR